MKARRPISGSPWATRLVVGLGLVLLAQLVAYEIRAMWTTTTATTTKTPGPSWLFLTALASSSAAFSAEVETTAAAAVAVTAAAVSAATAAVVDLSWHAPSQTALNNLTAALDGQGVYGFIYNSSDTPDELYGTYNWCNMPHVRPREYVRPPAGFELVYVELVRLLPSPLFVLSSLSFSAQVE